MSRPGHDAEERQRRVAAADVGTVLEHLGEAALARQVAELRAGIGDDGEAAAALGPRPTPTRGGCASRSWSRTSRRRGAACVPGSHSRPNRVMAAGSVVSSTWSRGRPGAGSSDAGQHLGEEAGAAHPHHEHVLDALDEGVAALGERRAGRPAPPRSRGSTRAGRPARWGRRARACGRRRTGGATASRSIRSRADASRTASSKSLTTSRIVRTRRARSCDRLAPASAAAATISSTTSPVWARPGNITS